MRRALGAAFVISGELTSLPTTTLALAVPSIHHNSHASVSELRWALTAYSLAYGAFLVIGGRLADLFGRARYCRIGSLV